MLLSQRLTATAWSSCSSSKLHFLCTESPSTRRVCGVHRTQNSSSKERLQYLCRRRFRSKMEFFAPQLRDTLPFRFVSEYYSMPLRAGRDSVTPICFWGLNKPKVTEVVQAGDPVLHEPALEVRLEDIGSARIEKIINDMVATMRNAPGVGLAAPQIGEPLQIIVLEDTKELMSYSSPEENEAQQRAPFDLQVIINPKLTRKSASGSAIFFEGCLSVDGYRALVERDLEVEVTGLGRDGKPVHINASGWKARILQHECDHLKGDLYVDKMIPRTFRTKENLRLPLAAGSPKPGPRKVSTKSIRVPCEEN